MVVSMCGAGGEVGVSNQPAWVAGPVIDCFLIQKCFLSVSVSGTFYWRAGTHPYCLSLNYMYQLLVFSVCFQRLAGERERKWRTVRYGIKTSLQHNIVVHKVGWRLNYLYIYVHNSTCLVELRLVLGGLAALSHLHRTKRI
jgi:hypothetical protein